MPCLPKSHIRNDTNILYTISPKSITQPKTASSKSINQPKTMSSKSITQPKMVSSKFKTQPKTVSSKSITQPHMVSPKTLTQPQMVSPKSLTQSQIMSSKSLTQQLSPVKPNSISYNLKSISYIKPNNKNTNSFSIPCNKPRHNESEICNISYQNNLPTKVPINPESSVFDPVPIFELNIYKHKISLPYTSLLTKHSPKNLSFLIDTGASISIIKLASLKDKPELLSDTVEIKGINDTDSFCSTLGSSYLQLLLNNKIYSHKFYVVDDNVNLKYDGIIGSDLLQTSNANIDYTSKIMTFYGYEVPILFDQPTYIIPARSEAVIECAISNYSSESYQNNEALVLDHTLSEGVYISNCIVLIKPNKKVNITVLNTTENKIEIKDYHVKLTPLDRSDDFNSYQNINLTSINSQTPSSSSRINKSRINQVLKLIRYSHLNDEEKKALLDCCSEYTDIFYIEGDPLSCSNAIEHSIDTGNAPPIHVKSYRFPECHKEEVETQIRKMLKQNIIRPSVSPWSAPVWVVPKKLDASGKRKWRIVIDYRRLNDVTVSEVYPLPLITDILDQLGHSKYFSTLDLASGFHQIKMAAKDAPKTGFTISTNSSISGHYEFTRMPFGLKNAPSTFQRLMNTVLSGLQGLHCYIYLDDCIIYSQNLQDHIEKLKLVFDKLRQFNLKLQPDKCEFLRREVTYLGHIITDKGVSPNPEKVKAVSQFRVPENPKEIKSFLGLIGYYRRFIDNFSKLTKPLTSLLKKNAVFNWSSEQQTAFENLKEKLITAPLLQYPDFSQPFVVTTDASNYAVGAVLSQGPIGKDKPIAYASRTLNRPEGNYSTTEKELLAIIFAVKTFRPYLYGNKFKIVTDHRPLVWLFNVKDPGSRLIRWRLKLEEYDYEIVYKQGRLNSNADALSRCPVNIVNINNLNNFSYEQYFKKQLINEIPTCNISIEECTRGLHLSKLNTIACPVSLDFDYSMPYCEEILSQLDNTNKILNSEREPFTILKIDDKNKNFYFLFTKVHHYEQTQYRDIYNLLTKLRNMLIINPDITDLAISDFSDPFSKLAYIKIYNMISCIFHNTNIKVHIYKNQLIYPTSVEVPIILKENHDSAIAGHPGSQRMYKRIKSSYYWKGMRSDIEDYVKKCKLCQINKPLRKSNKAPMEITSTSTRPFERLALDIVGPLPDAGLQNFKFILTLQDDLTKFTSAYPMVSSTSEEIARNLVHFMSLFGFPKTILTDLGTCFTSDLFKQLTEILKVKATFTTPYHPQTNGALERSHATLKEYLKSFVNENQNDWHCYLFTAILAYNTTPHCTTNYTPHELLYGYKPSIPNSLYETTSNTTYNEYIRALQYRMRYSREKAIQNIINSKEKSKQYYDISSREITYKVGDLVYLKHHHRLRKALSPIWKGPYKIIKIHNNHNVTLQIGRKKIKYHTNEIKPATS